MRSFNSRIKQSAANNACSGQVGTRRVFSIFLALSFSRFDGESQPTHLPLTRAVGQLKLNSSLGEKLSLNMNPKRKSHINQSVRRILAVMILSAIAVSCNSPLSLLFPTATPLPGWRSPTAYLFLNEKDLPEGWQLDFPGPTPEPDPTINANAREFYKVGSSISVYQIIWRAYTINDAQEHYFRSSQK